MALGNVIEIDERTLLVTGQQLVVEKRQPDVANSLLHLLIGHFSSSIPAPLMHFAAR
jgi:hypothetical protein